jgi:hypothetical protein
MSEKLNSRNAVLTGAKQTMASWSKVIESYEDVPDLYKSFFETQIADKRQFPHMVLAPAIVKPQGKTTEKLIYDTVDDIHILERSGNQVIARSYPYRSVCSVEMGCILLDSWLTISGLTGTGEAGVSTIDYNTSSARHYATFINKLRPLSPGADKTQLSAEQDKFNYLSTLNFKFMNYGRSSLVYGETVSQILLQPEIRESVWAPLGDMFQCTISLAHLVILTNHELILIQDVHERGRKAQKANYGGIWQYIQLRNIRSVTWTETENDRLTLSIAISPDRKIERLFAMSSKAEVERLCASF